jgi:dynein heavy chain, axonemal
MQVLQLHDSLEIHRGVVLVGQPFAGKSSAIKILSRALSVAGGLQEDKEVHVQTIFPMALPLKRLIGEKDSSTYGWKVRACLA